MDKFLYFRTVADVDNDDAAAGSATQLTSVCIPAKNIMSMAPASNTTLQIRYKSIKNSPASSAGASGDEILTDTVTLTVNEHTHKNVVDSLVAASILSFKCLSLGILIVTLFNSKLRYPNCYSVTTITVSSFICCCIMLSNSFLCL